MHSIQAALYVSLIPFILVWLAGLTIRVGKPSGFVVLLTQALAAGFILASISIELMPRILQAKSLTVAIGFALGFLLMLLIQKLGGGCGCSNKPKPLSTFLIPYAVEFFINALIIGIASATGHLTLIVIAVSLSLCCFVCGMSVSTRLFASRLSSSTRVSILLGLTLLFPIGALIGAWVMVTVPTIWLVDILSFSVAVLFYLVTVELLHESFQKKNSWVILAFFVAFLFVLMLHMLL